jgi:hypothetical protein
LAWEFRARGTVIVSGTAFGGMASIFSGSDAHVIATDFAQEPRNPEQGSQSVAVDPLQGE